MRSFKSLSQGLPSKTIVFSFGRCNPFTLGHELLVNTVKTVAKSNNNDYVIVLSKTQDSKRNPLSPEKKLYWANILSPNTNFSMSSTESPTLISSIKSLNTKYKNIVVVCGSDRVEEYSKLINKYNNKEYFYTSIEILSSGERDPDDNSISGISATKLREYALKNDIDKFKTCVPKISSVMINNYMNDIREGLGLDRINELHKLKTTDIREDFYNKKLFAIGNIVKDNLGIYEILDIGSNYFTVITEHGNISKKWPKELHLTEEIFTPQYFHSDKLSKTQLESFGSSILDYNENKFTDYYALVKAFKSLDEYYKDGNIKLLFKTYELLENIQQTHNHKYIEEILKMTEEIKYYNSLEELNSVCTATAPVLSDYEIVDTMTIDHSQDSEEKLNSIDDEELERMIDSHLTFDDYLDVYDDSELALVDDETGEDESIPIDEEVINEVLSRAERIKSRIRFARTQSKRERKISIALRRKSSTKTINARSRKLAVKILKLRLAKKPLNTLTISEKERLEKRIEKAKPILNRLAMKLVPRVKQVEKDRLHRQHFTKEAN